MDYFKSKDKRNMIKMACKILCKASFYNRIDILDWWNNNKLPLKYPRKLFYVRENFYDNWIDNKTPLYIDTNEHPMNLASEQNNVDVLEWWKNSKAPLRYTSWAIDYASEKGHIDVLNWWLKSGLPLYYTYYAIDNAIKNGHIEVLKWWINSGLKLKYRDAIYNAYRNPEIFSIVCEHKLYSGFARSEIIKIMASHGNIKYLEMIKITEDDFPCMTQCILDDASKNGHVHLLNWWVEHKFPIKYSILAMNYASYNGHVNVLEWWKNSGLELKYNPNCLNETFRNGHMNVIEWWKTSGLVHY
jgi:hypothetical protein